MTQAFDVQARANKTRIAIVPWVVWALGGTIGCVPSCLRAGEVPPASLGTNASRTVTLEYREFAHSLPAQSLTLTRHTEAFDKEPDFGKRVVHRGILKLGAETNHWMAFAWDFQPGKLYLDLNRNRDLTDDSTGVHSSSGPGSSQRQQVFTNVHLSLQTTAGVHRISVDLNFNTYGERLGCHANLRSLWEGKAVLGDRAWQVGLIDNLGGAYGVTRGMRLVLRPWEQRDQPVRLYYGWADALSFPTRLFLQDAAFRLNGAYVSEDGEPKFEVEFKPQQPKLGELELTGDFIERVVLSGGDYTVVLQTPDKRVKVPVGSYGETRIDLRNGGAAACRDASNRRDDQAATIREQQPARLTVGGPLTNSVLVNRRGKHLVFNYQLIGADGASYMLEDQDRTQPPEFAVYREGTRIASGKFEYG